MLSSCLCFRLRTGAVILGWLGILSCFFCGVLTVIGFFNIDYIVEKLETKDTTLGPEQWRLYVEICLSCILALIIINLIASSLLILGAVRVI